MTLLTNLINQCFPNIKRRLKGQASRAASYISQSCLLTVVNVLFPGSTFSYIEGSDAIHGHTEVASRSTVAMYMIKRFFFAIVAKSHCFYRHWLRYPCRRIMFELWCYSLFKSFSYCSRLSTCECLCRH